MFDSGSAGIGAFCCFVFGACLWMAYEAGTNNTVDKMEKSCNTVGVFVVANRVWECKLKEGK